jgi:aspartate kinase
MKCVVQKFGGTSMATSESINLCAAIAKKAVRTNHVVVVVSALGGATDQLLNLIGAAKRQKPKLVAAGLTELEERHRTVLAGFVDADSLETIWHDQFATLFRKLRLILTGASLVGDMTDRSTALVCAHGEQLSSRIMRHALRKAGCKAEVIDARRLISTDSRAMEASVDFSKTRTRFRRLVPPLLRRGAIVVVPGFFGKDAHGNTTLLGRGGSDYSGSIAAVSLDAARLEIWTDVDGILSADPRAVPRGVRTWETIELPVVAEMAHSGAKVLHPKTITAAVKSNIPVIVRNTFRPEVAGTTIVPRGQNAGLRGVVVERGQAICHFTEPTMLDSFGFIYRCTEAFARHGVPIDACATSEITLSCSLRSKDLNKKLLDELGKIAEVRVIDRLAKVCVIGHDIMDDPKMIARIMTCIPAGAVHLVSQGASRMNLTMLIPEDQAGDILTALHASLFSDER